MRPRVQRVAAHRARHSRPVHRAATRARRSTRPKDSTRATFCLEEFDGAAALQQPRVIRTAQRHLAALDQRYQNGGNPSLASILPGGTSSATTSPRSVTSTGSPERTSRTNSLSRFFNSRNIHNVTACSYIIKVGYLPNKLDFPEVRRKTT